MNLVEQPVEIDYEFSLFSDVLRGVGSYSKGDGKRQGGMKVQMLNDAAP